MLERYLGQHKNTPLGWEELGAGAPTIVALARLAAEQLVTEDSAPNRLAAAPSSDNKAAESSVAGPAAAEPSAGASDPLSATLSNEARTLLYAARQRGVFAIRGNNQAFDSSGRFLMVHVEQSPDQYLRFGSKDSPLQTIRFLEGFAELCRQGLILHHLFHEFSLSSRGFKLAETIDPPSIEPWLKMGVDPLEADR